MPASTNTTIAACVQIQVGFMASTVACRAGRRDYRVGMAGRQSRAKVGRPGVGLMVVIVALLVQTVAAMAGTPPAGGATRAGAPVGRAAAARPLGGVNIDDLFTHPSSSAADRDVAYARALHARVVRLEVPWSVFEPAAAGQLDAGALAVLDRLVSDAAAGGIRVIATVESTPCWASSAPASLLRKCVAGRRGRANEWPPRQPATYASFVAMLAGRYGTRLAAIEVWNEPDQANEEYFAGPEKPQRYAAILRSAYPAIKQANPNVPVLAGSLVGSNGVFLRALYAAGIKGYYDGLAVHFYNLLLASVRAIHETQLANGDRTPLWLDEFGWSSCWPAYGVQQEQGCVTQRTQAQNITDTFRSLARTPYVAAAVLYELRGTRGEDFGVLRGERRKPAFAALSRVLASPFGSPSRVTLSLGVRRGAVLASGSGPVGDYMQLEASQGGVLRYRALFTLDRFDRYAIPLPRALGTHGLTVRVFQYWAGRAAGVQRSI